MVSFFTALVDYFAPMFLIASPVTSYADQILSIHRTKTSAGFSLDIPLIMLLASILKIFYYFGSPYDRALLVQAILMVFVQLTLLRIALLHRPPSSISTLNEKHAPFHNYHHHHHSSSSNPIITLLTGPRPYNFWRWPHSAPYFRFLLYLVGGLTVIQLFLPFIAHSPLYISLLGGVGLAIEATLPLPQMYKNYSARSCKGFRVSVVVNWLMGDAMKMSYFFLSSEPVPWPFKACGLFQAGCDAVLGWQFWRYGSGSEGEAREVLMGSGLQKEVLR